jgi:hypothetical protein
VRAENVLGLPDRNTETRLFQQEQTYDQYSQRYKGDL